jgi:hypothetical protein
MIYPGRKVGTLLADFEKLILDSLDSEGLGTRKKKRARSRSPQGPGIVEGLGRQPGLSIRTQGSSREITRVITP